MQVANKSKAGRPKSQQKKEQILQAAAEHFLLDGFSNTSMDQVAKTAGVSKQTVYSHFANKDALFSACIEIKCQEYSIDKQLISEQNMDLSALLKVVGRQMLRLFHDEKVIAMYQVVIAESKTAPQVAELFYQAGPMRAITMLSAGIECIGGQELDAKQSTEMAFTFFNLLKGEMHMRSLLNLPYQMTEEAQRQQVNKVVDYVMKIFCSRP